MRRCWLMTIGMLLVSGLAAAQQGSVQVVAASQITTGDPARTGVLHTVEPDFGVLWLQPGTRLGNLQFDLHAVRRNSDPRLGRGLFALDNLQAGGLKWNVQAGDAVHTPFLREYGFNNLVAPQITFRGTEISGRNDRTSFNITAGRATVLRDLFGSDAEVLGQTLVVARLAHRLNGRVEVNGRVSRVRTQDLKEYSYLFQSGDDAGAGVRIGVTPSLQLVADGGYTSFRRRGSAEWEQRGSLLVGGRWTGTRGWLQVNAHRFAPGNFSVMNYAYNDREGVYAAGQYDVTKRVRAFAAWDVFRVSLDQQVAEGAAVAPRSTGSRAYGGVRLRVNSHLFLGGRLEQGARTFQPSRYSVGYESDGGVATGEWQLTFSRWNAVGRYERRADVESSTARRRFDQHDVSAQVYFNAITNVRLFASAFATTRHDAAGGAQSFWQASGGSQLHVRGLFARAELIISRNRDLRTDFLMPRTAFSGGVSGQISSHLALSLDTFVDRSPMPALGTPWMSRTLARLTYTLPTAAWKAAGPARGAHAVRGNETIAGIVFIDWNGNGVQDADEAAVGGMAILLDGEERVTADGSGRFEFRRVATGGHVVSLDVATVPADFDPPASPAAELDVRKAARPSVAYGLFPLGDVEGSVRQDANGDGVSNADDPAVDAVVVLDDGARTEVTHEGRFRFAGVRLGAHTVKVLSESLADGSALVGDGQVTVELTRGQRTAAADFLVKLQKRPEIRKTFPPKRIGTDAGSPGAQTDATAASGEETVVKQAPRKSGRGTARAPKGRTSQERGTRQEPAPR